MRNARAYPLLGLSAIVIGASLWAAGGWPFAGLWLGLIVFVLGATQLDE